MIVQTCYENIHPIGLVVLYFIKQNVRNLAFVFPAPLISRDGCTDFIFVLYILGVGELASESVLPSLSSPGFQLNVNTKRVLHPDW